ncbi:MAG: hypothetical protein HY862_06485 [Chloroflexi bacterium]|nr:hypothetical protein [Chloroflexota bacterium]
MRKWTLGILGIMVMGLVYFGATWGRVSGAAPRQANTPTPTAAGADTPGHIAFVLNDHLYLIEATESATPIDISAAWDENTPGADAWVDISPDGAWLLISTERFDSECTGWACMVLTDPILEHIEVIRSAGAVWHPEDGAIASGGNLIIFTDGGGPHERDLWAITRDGEAWSAPQLLTADSPYAFNLFPAVADDGSTVVFTCTHDAYAIEQSAVCEVEIETVAFQTVLMPEQGPGGTAKNATIHPDYAPDGSIVFEADWQGEQIWRLAPEATTPELVNPDFSNDNSPCVLPDGRIVSLWLGRADNTDGLHELKVMNADGTGDFMLVIDQDIVDGGLGCGA